MSEINVYGSTVASSSLYDTGIDNIQYAIFQLKPEFKNSYNNNRFGYWLKDVGGVATFAAVTNRGTSTRDGSSNQNYGVRPRFLIG